MVITFMRRLVLIYLIYVHLFLATFLYCSWVTKYCSFRFDIVTSKGMETKETQNMKLGDVEWTSEFSRIEESTISIISLLILW